MTSNAFSRPAPARVSYGRVLPVRHEGSENIGTGEAAWGGARETREA